MRKPKWWNKPITWGNSVTMSLLSIPISLLWLLIMDVLTRGSYGIIDTLGDKVNDIKDWTCDLFDK